jgi:hypothetical protein
MTEITRENPKKIRAHIPEIIPPLIITRRLPTGPSGKVVTNVARCRAAPVEIVLRQTIRKVTKGDRRLLQVEPPIILHTRSTKNTPPTQPAVLFVEQALTNEEREQVLKNLGLTDVLRYTAQILTPAEQKRARDNIGYVEPRDGKDGKDGVDGKDGEKGDKGEDGADMSTDQFAAKMAEVLGLAAAVGGAAGTVLGLVGKGVGDLFSKLFSGDSGTGGSPTDDSTARRDELLRGCVRYDKAQDLPDAQKERARDNIGAGTGGDYVTHSQARATYVAFDRPTNLDDAQARTARTNMRVREDFVSFRETQELDEEAAARARLNLRVQDQLISYREAQELTVEQRTLVRNTLHITNRVVLGSPGEDAPPRRTRAVAGPQGQRGPPGRGSLIIYQNDWHLSQKSVHITRTEHHRQLLQSNTSMAIDVGRLRALETRLRQLELLVSDIDANRPVATE